MVRKYKGTREEYEQKLGRVMGRLGVQVYDYDWSRRGCWVQMVYAGRAYRFENSVDKSAHPDAGGDEDAFLLLRANLNKCLTWFAENGRAG